MDPAKYAEIFLEESREHLTQINQQLLAWERTPAAPEPVAAIFRSVHNVKGMAATMGYQAVAILAHRVENLLDLLRRKGGEADGATLDLLFRATDTLEQAIDAEVGGRKPPEEVDGLCAELDGVAGALESKQRKRRPSADRPSMPAIETPAAAGRLIRAVVRPDAPLKGARALLLLRAAEGLGAVSSVQPAPAVFEGEDFEGIFQFRLDADAADARVLEVLRGVGEIQNVEIVTEPSEGDETQREAPEAGGTRHIRVDLRRLDRLMNLIGELVIARGRLVELSNQRADPDLEDLVIRVSHLTQDLQSEIIEARMTPGWQVFDRFPRLVRDVARRLGKRVEFEIEGKEIELDRSILDELGDPLVHLLRNAVDHGIESPEDREAAGKPAVGHVTLSAVRERSTVVIRVEDDGRGIDRAAVLADAKVKGLVDEDAEELSDDVLLRVLARPGFSTAQSVSDVSGRGVGIDVVMTRLRSFGGSVELKTTVGQGSAFTLRLPPTLAIVPALLAHVGDERYALPLTHVEETVDFDQQTVTTVDGTDAIVLREEVIPLVRLRSLVDLAGTAPRRQPVIILQIGDRRTGVVVDQLGGQREIVVKTFDAPRGTVPIFSGVTILGDGAVVFILDAARLM